MAEGLGPDREHGLTPRRLTVIDLHRRAAAPAETSTVVEHAGLDRAANVGDVDRGVVTGPSLETVTGLSGAIAAGELLGAAGAAREAVIDQARRARAPHAVAHYRAAAPWQPKPARTARALSLGTQS